jgi:hypothetical protein
LLLLLPLLPLLAQTPRLSQRAAPYKPKAAILVTGQNLTLTKTLSEHLVPNPRVTLEDLLATSTYQQGFADDVGSKAKTAVAGELLSLLGFSRLGTSSRIAVTVYLETAFAGVSDGIGTSLCAVHNAESSCKSVAWLLATLDARVLANA